MSILTEILAVVLIILLIISLGFFSVWTVKYWRDLYEK